MHAHACNPTHIHMHMCAHMCVSRQRERERERERVCVCVCVSLCPCVCVSVCLWPGALHLRAMAIRALILLNDCLLMRVASLFVWELLRPQFPEFTDEITAKSTFYLARFRSFIQSVIAAQFHEPLTAVDTVGSFTQPTIGRQWADS